jgi:hypothetical protein
MLCEGSGATMAGGNRSSLAGTFSEGALCWNAWDCAL